MEQPRKSGAERRVSAAPVIVVVDVSDPGMVSDHFVSLVTECDHVIFNYTAVDRIDLQQLRFITQLNQTHMATVALCGLNVAMDDQVNAARLSSAIDVFIHEKEAVANRSSSTQRAA